MYEKNNVIGVKGNFDNGKEKEFFANVIIGADGPYSTVSRKTGCYNADGKYTAVGLRCYYENIGGLTDQIAVSYTHLTLPTICSV